MICCLVCEYLYDNRNDKNIWFVCSVKLHTKDPGVPLSYIQASQPVKGKHQLPRG